MTVQGRIEYWVMKDRERYFGGLAVGCAWTTRTIGKAARFSSKEKALEAPGLWRYSFKPFPVRG